MNVIFKYKIHVDASFLCVISLTSVSFNMVGLNCFGYLKLDSDTELTNPYSTSKVESGPTLL